jgi:glyoxylase-like metal-dependent hydrolase (beta-lactamase superfamily II)
MWPEWPAKKSPFFENLAAEGIAPQDVDIVLNTHMHFDHVGGFTRLDDGKTRIEDGKAVLAFPNARYIFGREEYEATKAEADGGATFPAFARVFYESVQPVVDAGRAEFIVGQTHITPSIKAVPAPGHSAGHYRFDISSKGETAIISGDIFHYPVQIQRTITENTTYDRARDEATREELYGVAADREAVVLPTHVFDPGVVRIFRRNGGFDYTVGW